MVSAKSLTKKKSKTLKIILVAVGIFVIIVVGIVISTIRSLSEEVKFSVPVPAAWQQLSETGSIASLCSGGGSECGSITRSYETHQIEAEILTSLKQSTQENGWQFNAGSNGGLSKATLRNPIDEATASVLIEGSVVKIKYVHP